MFLLYHLHKSHTWYYCNELHPRRGTVIHYYAVWGGTRASLLGAERASACALYVSTHPDRETTRMSGLTSNRIPSQTAYTIPSIFVCCLKFKPCFIHKVELIIKM
jgi:hypothetical protein